MKFLAFLLLSLCTFSAVAQASTLLDLEKKIAYQQGQFGALYERCGTPDEKAVIGGSLSTWRTETFQGYNGIAEEHAALEKSFDEASTAVALDANSCQDWIKQAAATWHGIVTLAQQGMPVASNP